jgi:hypothetical protein
LDKTHWAKDPLGDIKKIVTMEITAPTEIGDVRCFSRPALSTDHNNKKHSLNNCSSIILDLQQYFIGLWALVKRRMDRFGA